MSLRQYAIVDCTRVSEPCFPFEISGKNVYYSNLKKRKSIKLPKQRLSFCKGLM